MRQQLAYKQTNGTVAFQAARRLSVQVLLAMKAKSPSFLCSQGCSAQSWPQLSGCVGGDELLASRPVSERGTRLLHGIVTGMAGDNSHTVKVGCSLGLCQ